MSHSLFISIGLLTRNNSLDFELSHAKISQKKLFHTIIRNFGYCGNYSPLTAMQISSGDPSLSSSNTQVITLDTFKKFLETRQIESKTEAEIKKIIEVIISAWVGGKLKIIKVTKIFCNLVYNKFFIPLSWFFLIINHNLKFIFKKYF